MQSFKREAESVLRTGGYAKSRTTGKEHDVWEYPDGSRPVIHLPSTPRDPDHALIRLRRAVRKGTTPHIPQGTETDVMPPKTKHVDNGRTLVEQLVRHAPASLQRRARDIDADPERWGKAGTRLPAAAPKDIAAWLRKCIDAHGPIPGTEIAKAGEQLHLASYAISGGRAAAGMVSYRVKGDPVTYTDYAKRVAQNEAAMVMGAPGKPRGRYKKRAEKVVTLPIDPDEVRGRRLDRPDGMTDEQYEAAERMMRESTQRADAELAERRGVAINLDGQTIVVGVPGETQHTHIMPPDANGNGKPMTQLEAAMQLMVEAALAETHALTEEDIILIRGHQDTLRRHADEATGMAASLGMILARVEARAAV